MKKGSPPQNLLATRVVSVRRKPLSSWYLSTMLFLLSLRLSPQRLCARALSTATTTSTTSSLSSLPPLPKGMTSGVKIDVEYTAAVASELSNLGSRRPFLLASNSMRPAVEKLQQRLREDGLQCEVSYGVKQGGGEEGLLDACRAAAASESDAVVTVGGGAVQDLGKLVRLWVAEESSAVEEVDDEPLSLDVLLTRALRSRHLVLSSVPQLAVPTGFAQAEYTGLAGVVRTKSDDKDKEEGGFKASTTSSSKVIFDADCLVPSGVVYDPALSASAPGWLRYGTALRCVDHAVEAATHPLASEDGKELAYAGLEQVARGLRGMVALDQAASADAGKGAAGKGAGAGGGATQTTQQEKEQGEAPASTIYRGGIHAMMAFAGVGYGAGHFLENQFSARFDCHQGACSSLLMWRMMHHHRNDAASAAAQARIAQVLSEETTTTTTTIATTGSGSGGGGGSSGGGSGGGGASSSAARLVHDLCASIPGMPVEFSNLPQASAPSEEELVAFSEFMFRDHVDTLNEHCPEPFQTSEDILALLRTTPGQL